MKKLLLFIALCFSINFCWAQDINKPVAFHYCEIVGTSKFMSSKVTIQIDYGQEKSFWKDNRVKDENGNVQSFNSMVDALNYMGLQGWEFVQAYIVSTSANSYVYHFMLKKKN